ncbi:hypothetical protein PsYK624_018340 [Phanerochaete sordida]|uniref:Uncharacterized protein n=1 Tax=Phanerochaete sordida TaxID=48140 RepID=A0A9P3G119_9APHY|nr:hypothetical protein PsYK624_018340 [Phanerochaete sordida]
MAETRQRTPPLPPLSTSSSSSVATSSSLDLPRAPKRRSSLADTPQMMPTQIMTTFPVDNQFTGYPHNAGKSRSSSSRTGIVATLPTIEPSPTDEDVVFIHPPFNDFPDAHKYPEGLTYNVLATNPNFFLVASDYRRVGDSLEETSDTIQYPTVLEPPRGWLQSDDKKWLQSDDKKRSKDAKKEKRWPEGQAPRLRCTFCRRTYAGVNAKSMWRRHVFEKHRIAMSNRRADAGERKGRGKENDTDVEFESKPISAAARGAAKAEKEAKAERQTSTSVSSSKRSRAAPDSPTDWSKARTSFTRTRSLPASQLEDSAEENDIQEGDSFSSLLPPFALADSSTSFSSTDFENESFNISAASSTPPLTPEVSSHFSPASRRRDPAKIVDESPYNPLLTPSFRHSPPRLPSDQPWRYPSPSHPFHRDLTLSMLACGEANSTLSGLDVSPVVLLPASERSKRSIYSSPIFMSKKDGSSPDVDTLLKSRGLHTSSPRRLFSDTALPIPFHERIRSIRVPETPGNSKHTPTKQILGSSVKKGTSLRHSIFSPLRSSPNKSNRLLAPIDLASEDPFTDGAYGIKQIFVSNALEDTPETPPDSSEECDSPVLRTAQLSSSQGSRHVSYSRAADGGIGHGIGLMEGFSPTGSPSKDGGDSLMDATLNETELPLSRRDSKRARTASTASAAGNSPFTTSRPTKKPRKEFLMDAVLDGDVDFEVVIESYHGKKRRRTITSRDHVHS